MLILVLVLVALILVLVGPVLVNITGCRPILSLKVGCLETFSTYWCNAFVVVVVHDVNDDGDDDDVAVTD